MVHETGLDKPKVDETGLDKRKVDETAVDEPGPHPIIRSGDMSQGM